MNGSVRRGKNVLDRDDLRGFTAVHTVVDSFAVGSPPSPGTAPVPAAQDAPASPPRPDRASDPPRKPMEGTERGIVATYLVVLSTAALTTLAWAWHVTSQVLPPADAGASAVAAAVPATFLWWTFTAVLESMLFLVVMVSAVVGSLVYRMQQFSLRAGYGTLEKGFVWWYVLGPLGAAGLGALFYGAVLGGFFPDVVGSGRSALAVAATTGALAGLFTDSILTKLRSLLGLKDPETKASEQRGPAGSGASAGGGTDPATATRHSNGALTG